MRVGLVSFVLLMLPLQAAATSGDLVPAPAGDGTVSVADLVEARRLIDGTDVPTTAQRRALDVGSGRLETAFITPPTYFPVRDAALNEGDLARLRDVVLGRKRFPDTPGALLRVGRPVALAGVAWRNRVMRAGLAVGPVTYALDGAPDGMTIDAAGVIAWTPPAGQPGSVSFGITAGSERCRVDLTVVVPRTEATGDIGAGGGELQVDDAASPVNGLRLDVEPGALTDTTRVTIYTASTAADPARDDGLPLGPPVIIDGITADDAELSIPAGDALIAAAGGADRLAWEVLSVPFADCENRTAAPGRATWWPAWTRVPSSLSGGRLTATISLSCMTPAMARLVAIPVPPAACPAGNAGQDVALDVRACPQAGTWSVADARAAVLRARDRFASLGYDAPQSVTVVIDDLGAGHSAYADAVAPATLRLDASLSRERMLVAAMHETFHLCQQRALGTGCADSTAARSTHVLLIEAAATWMEQEVLDLPDDPIPSDAVPGRVLPTLTRRPLESLGAEGWPFFDWLDASAGVTPLDVLDRGPALLTTPPLVTIDALLTEAGRGPWVEALTRFAHDLNVERDPRFIRELEELALPEAAYDLINASVTAADPLVRCEIVLSPGAAFTWPLLIDTSEERDGSAAYLKVEAAGSVQATFYAVDGPERLRTIAPGTTAAIGLGIGSAALHVVNTRTVAEPDDPAVVSLTAWAAIAVPYETDTDGDGWPDQAEREAGTDPRRASSYPLDALIAAPPIQVALTRRDPVTASPPASVIAPGHDSAVSSVPLQIALTRRDPVAADPTVQLALTARDPAVAAPPVTALRHGP